MIFIAVSTGHFDPLIEACAEMADRYEFVGQIGSGRYVPPFRHFRTLDPEALDEYFLKAEIVISHGGTGMLSRLYDLKKAAIIVPKQRRYGEANDSQMELAVQWAELGMGVLCLDITGLEKAIAQYRAGTFEFPSFPPLGRRLRTLIAG